jgi:hypothetical protein
MLCGEVFLPGLAIASVNIQLESALWAVLKQANYQMRY